MAIICVILLVFILPSSHAFLWNLFGGCYCPIEVFCPPEPICAPIPACEPVIPCAGGSNGLTDLGEDAIGFSLPFSNPPINNFNYIRPLPPPRYPTAPVLPYRYPSQPQMNPSATYQNQPKSFNLQSPPVNFPPQHIPRYPSNNFASQRALENQPSAPSQLHLSPPAPSQLHLSPPAPSQQQQQQLQQQEFSAEEVPPSNSIVEEPYSQDYIEPAQYSRGSGRTGGRPKSSSSTQQEYVQTTSTKTTTTMSTTPETLAPPETQAPTTTTLPVTAATQLQTAAVEITNDKEVEINSDNKSIDDNKVEEVDEVYRANILRTTQMLELTTQSVEPTRSSSSDTQFSENTFDITDNNGINTEETVGKSESTMQDEQIELMSDESCSNTELKAIIRQNIENDIHVSKRLIKTAAEKRFGGDFVVVCADNDFSFITNTELYCQETLGDISCYAYQEII